VQRLNSIKIKIKEIIDKTQLKTQPQIIAVSKTFPLTSILPLVESGHLHFGENKIQEAEEKWTEMKNKNNKLQLHMIGKLQSNKAKKAVKLFDYIHSLDSENLAKKISQYQIELSKGPKLFIQINIGEEEQKSGILIKNLNEFYNYCIKDLSLNIVGLMCLPPINIDPTKYFKILKNKTNDLNLPELSIGMTGDYEKALSCETTFLRLGTAIFGERSI
jgi:PLP dependent protein